jgi:hypothetical protein
VVLRNSRGMPINAPAAFIHRAANRRQAAPIGPGSSVISTPAHYQIIAAISPACPVNF